MFTFTGFAHVCSARTVWPRSAVFAKSWKLCSEPCRYQTVNFLLFLSDCSVCQWTQKISFLVCGGVLGLCGLREILVRWQQMLFLEYFNLVRGFPQTVKAFISFSLTIWLQYVVVLKQSKTKFWSAFLMAERYQFVGLACICQVV